MIAGVIDCPTLAAASCVGIPTHDSYFATRETM